MSSTNQVDCNAIRTQIIANLRFIHPNIPASSPIEIVTSPRFIAAVAPNWTPTAYGAIPPVLEGNWKVLRQVKTISVTDPLRYGRGAEMRLRDALVELLESTEAGVGNILEELELTAREKHNGLV